MSRRWQYEAAKARVFTAIDVYGDSFSPTGLADIFDLDSPTSALKEAIMLRIEQFAMRDEITHAQIYAFVASDLLTAIAELNHGAELTQTIMFAPKVGTWVDSGRAELSPQQSTRFFLNNPQPIAGKELIGRKDVAWTYTLTPGNHFSKVVLALVAFVPLAIDEVLRTQSFSDL